MVFKCLYLNFKLNSQAIPKQNLIMKNLKMLLKHNYQYGKKKTGLL